MRAQGGFGNGLPKSSGKGKNKVHKIKKGKKVLEYTFGAYS